MSKRSSALLAGPPLSPRRRRIAPLLRRARALLLVSLACVIPACSADSGSGYPIPHVPSGTGASSASANGGAHSGSANGGTSVFASSGAGTSGSAGNGGTASSAGTGGTAGASGSSNGGAGGFGSGGVSSSVTGGAAGAAGAANDGGAPMTGVPPQCQGPKPFTPCAACTYQGLLSGMVESQSCAYLGIPYAKPPKDALRFAPPEAAAGWSGVRDATKFGPGCVQGPGLDLSFASSTGEDCLYLNVWAPTKAPAKQLPVMVFIHGGWFVAGAPNLYDFTGLGEKGPVVVVSVNYRLGALGFFAHPDLDKQRPGKPSGSDGIRDQQLALQWIHDNIATFSGDPNNVTVFGQSAGASSVGVHVVSPGTRGLAHRFIMESGAPTRNPSTPIAPYRDSIAALPRDRMYQVTKQMAADLCPSAGDPIACLRALPADTLMKWVPSSSSSASVNWAPVVEGPNGVLPDTPDALLSSGKFNDGPIVIGSNKNEWSLFADASTPATLADLNTQVQALFPDSVDQVMALYAPNGTADIKQAYITMMSDAVFRCPVRSFARLASAHDHDVYLYSFEEGPAPHAGELGYLIDYGLFTLTFPAPAMVDAIQGYWTNFARSGDPNGGSLTKWPKYDVTSDQNLKLVNPPDVATGLEKAACDFWDGYVAKH